MFICCFKIFMKSSRQRQATNIRTSRKIHRNSALFLFVFFIFISISGILLGLKKHSGDMISPKTYSGSSSDFKKWIPLEQLHSIANRLVHDSISPDLSLKLDRIDIRKEKGLVKFIFEDHLWEIQLDGATGNLINYGKRHSDLIENIHDGSVLDRYFGTTNGQIKLIYSTITGLALLLFTLTGFWLWYGPKRMKKH